MDGVKCRQILYKAAMALAVLAGIKTQTSRLVKGIALEWLESLEFTPEFVANPKNNLCPYGNPGDQLWGREGWRTVAEADHLPPRDLNPAHRIWYEADALHQPGAGKLRPSMFMPRWASRILLEIVSVRVERLQDISEADARAEGINCYPFRPDDGFPICSGYTHKMDDRKCGLWPTAVLAYKELWESINGPGSWDANPWVWVVEFKLLKGGQQ